MNHQPTTTPAQTPVAEAASWAELDAVIKRFGNLTTRLADTHEPEVEQTNEVRRVVAAAARTHTQTLNLVRAATAVTGTGGAP